MQLPARAATGVLLSPRHQEGLSPISSESFVNRVCARIPTDNEIGVIRSFALPAPAGGEVQQMDLEPWLQIVLQPYLANDATFYFGDLAYYLPATRDIQEAWRTSNLQGCYSIPQRFDCDDFAFAFKGHCSRYAYARSDWRFFGICVGFVTGRFWWAASRHAANLFVDYNSGNPEVKFIEPKTGDIHALTECTEIRHLFF